MYSHRRNRRHVFCMRQSLACLLLLFCLPAIVHAQQPTAAITAMNGDVMISMQGAAFQTAVVGDSLQAGDIIETGTGAGVVLLLSEGSELRLGQKTRIDVVVLSQRPEDRSRTSLINLMYGRIRAFLSAGHQEEGSSFTIETPNAIAGVKFSRPVIEASYDPATKTSIFKAYTVALNVTNRVTREIKQVTQGSQAIIQENSIVLAPLSSPDIVPTPEEPFQDKPAEAPPQETPDESPPDEVSQEAPVNPDEVSPASQDSLPSTSQAPTRGSIMTHARGIVRGTTSTTVPISVGTIGTGDTEGPAEAGGDGAIGETTATETSTNPSPGARPEDSIRPRPVAVTIHEE